MTSRHLASCGPSPTRSFTLSHLKEYMPSCVKPNMLPPTIDLKCVRLVCLSIQNKQWDGERRTECRRMQCRHLLIEQFREEVDIVLVGRGFLPSPQHAPAPVL